MRAVTARRSSRVRVSWSHRSGAGFAPCTRRPRAACVAGHYLCSTFHKIERCAGLVGRSSAAAQRRRLKLLLAQIERVVMTTP